MNKLEKEIEKLQGELSDEEKTHTAQKKKVHALEAKMKHKLMILLI